MRGSARRLAEARLALVAQGNEKTLPGPAAREAILILPQFYAEVQAVLEGLLREPIMADPLAKIHQREQSDRIAAALQQLDDLSRSAVVLRYYENLSSREIGQLIGLSPAATFNRVKRLKASGVPVTSD